MIAHFKTACGAEQYKHIEHTDSTVLYRIPISSPATMSGAMALSSPATMSVAMTQRVTYHTYRVFTLVSIDKTHMAHYEEVLDERLFKL